ncbi:hypothetical protein AVEN_363-1 [Araneus ventricosus]|uniref:Uncharacterized protein n=1 Tax=Araneus ventricosus TaxID=182803 RepID=A0A4Y2DRV6_ARAVE|nr:hypothetical protein AVEN_363-1 [Araneus ventricosus]
MYFAILALEASTRTNQLSVEVSSEPVHEENFSSNKTSFENYRIVDDFQKYRYIIDLLGPLCILCSLAVVLRTLDASTRTNQLSVEVSSELIHQENFSSTKTSFENYRTVDDLQKYRVGYIVSLFGPLCILCVLAVILRKMKGYLCF